MSEPAKKKRLCCYKKEWEARRPWVKAVATDARKAFCAVCCRELTIGHGGENDLTRHEGSDVHKKAVLAKGASNIGTSCATSLAEIDRIAANEVAYVYHTIKHGLGYNSTDCAVKLNGTLFEDSCVAKKMHLGKTKAEMITMNVLGPSTVREVVSYLSPAEAQPVYFSLASDAGNKGNRKMFPVCVRYFSVSDGV